ncbi:MAG: hydrolase, partial [Devosia sp.]
TEPNAKAELYALLHDAPEYVMGDIISPFKAAMGGNYKEVENRLLGAIYLHFSLAAAAPAAIAKQIKKADKEAAFYEAVHLAGFELEEARRFFGEPAQAGFDLDGFDQLIRPWPTREAYDRLVAEVESLIHRSSLS